MARRCTFKLCGSINLISAPFLAVATSQLRRHAVVGSHPAFPARATLPSHLAGAVGALADGLCPVRAFSFPPIRMTTTDSQIQIIKPMTAPSEP